MTMETCRWCGNMHGPLCPAVKSIEYDETGAIVRKVEFFAPNDYGPKLGWAPGQLPAMWPNGIPPGVYGPAYAFGGANHDRPMVWNDAVGWLHA